MSLSVQEKIHKNEVPHQMTLENPPGISGISHGYRSVDGGSNATAVAAVATAASPSSEVLIHGQGISDESLLCSSISPDGGKRRSRSPSRDDSAASRRRTSSSQSQRRTSKVVHKFAPVSASRRRPASTPRAMGRAASPMLPPLAIQMGEPPRPETASTSTGDVYVRVTALERQGALDHEYLSQMVRAVRGIEANFDKAHKRLEMAEEELRNPRRDFTIRDRKSVV